MVARRSAHLGRLIAYDSAMDPNSTGRDRPPSRDQIDVAPRLRPRRVSGAGRQRGAIATAIFIVVLVVLVAGVAVAGGLFAGSSSVSPTPTGPQLAAGSPTAAGSSTVTTSSMPTPSPTPPQTSSPTPAPTAPPVPALLGASGDSYTQAWSVSPQYLLDHTQFSWAIGTDKGDGVFSLLERFGALGGSPVVVDAATSGRKMDDAPRQAAAVVAAAAKLAPGKTAYVTFELGINDLCASPDLMTDSAVRSGEAHRSFM